MGRCRSCGQTSQLIARFLGYCVECIRQNSPAVSSEIQELHRQVRAEFGLPEEPPSSSPGKRCGLCVNECVLNEEAVGLCGLPLNRGEAARLDFYHDPLPTNCVADWVCAEGGSVNQPGCGYFNLAVFYRACSFNCLGCQNWHYRLRSRTVEIGELLEAVDERTRCVCFFGGDPAPNAPHALRFARRALSLRPLRICWETNGSESRELFRQMLELSFESGGCVKVDLKAFSEPLQLALSGVSNRRTLDNLRLTRDWIARRPEPPLLVVSTLLVPGYIDEKELSGIADFLAELSPEIPWALLGFYPCFYLKDLPCTSWPHARLAAAIARDAGLKKVHIGNQHLLSYAY